jgi:hypothetical protein
VAQDGVDAGEAAQVRRDHPSGSLPRSGSWGVS